MTGRWRTSHVAQRRALAHPMQAQWRARIGCVGLPPMRRLPRLGQAPHQHLQKPDARTVDEQRIADRLLQAESFFHQSPRIGVAGIKAAPTELDQRARDLLRLSVNAPQGHRLVF